MKYFFFFSLLLLVFTQGYSQQSIIVKGVVHTYQGKPLSSATVLLYYKGSKDSLKVISQENGEFKFPNAKAKNTGLIVTFVGYNTFTGSYDFTNLTGEQRINDIVMTAGSGTLDNVTLESSRIQIKEDTVSYQIDSTMFRKNDNVEQVLKNLPGVQVDKNGTVTAQGKEVTKVKVNGKEFFGGDVRTATRELNADMVDKIQIIDDYGDQASFTGVKDGDPTKTMNIQLKKDKNKGVFGNISAGAGTDQRYLTSVSVNKFNNNQQLSLIGNLNNTNASSFNFPAIGGAIGNMAMGMMKSMGIGQGGGGIGAALGNFGISDGIGTTKSIGLNYRDGWGKKISAYGSYSFSRKSINTIKNISRQNFSTDFPNTNLQNSNDNSLTDNHRFSFNIEYSIDSANYLKFNPTVSYRKTLSNYYEDHVFLNEYGGKVNDGTINEYAESKVPNLNGSLLFNHRFHKKGRSVSLNLNAGESSTDGMDDVNNYNTYYIVPGVSGFNEINHQYIPQENENRNYTARISYTEPFSKKRGLEINYAYYYQYTGNDREVFKVDSTNKLFIDSLSSIYDNIYVTNRIGVNFRTNQKKYNYTIGLAVQPGSIQSNNKLDANDSYTQHLLNFYPVVRFAYNFSKSRSFNLNYNGSTNQPNYSQLNPVPDNSNSQYIAIGNPDLKPEFTSTLSSRYNNFDFISGNVFFGAVALSFTKDKIVTNTRQLGSATQEIRYRNSEGFYTATAFYNLSRPKQNRKYVFNWGGNIIYNNNVSYINNAKNIAGNWVFGQRLSEDLKIRKWLETNFAVNYSLNGTRNSLQLPGLSNTTTNTWTLTNSSRIFIQEDFILSYDIDKAFNKGYSANVNADPLIINATLEKQFLKKKNLAVKLQAFDLLNENKGISRTVTGTSIMDTRVNRLSRYFMLSFVL
ncbi:MAG: outer membrane beta-barrel protein, partial [Ferruginibacter sp.]